MKVIYAGYSKTGTKTITAVFHQFGYKTYDWLENSWYLGKEWRKIIKEGGTVDDFKRMYEDVDAIVDAPCYFYWEEIHAAYPDAKIIFSARDEETWASSLSKQVDSMRYDPWLILMEFLSYSGWQYWKYRTDAANLVIGAPPLYPWSKAHYNTQRWKRMYRNHNAGVLQNAPKDKLLVYNFKDGWGPLCEFLGEEVPDKPFPRANIGASIMREYMETHPIMIRMMREMMFSLGVITFIGVYGDYKIYRNPANIKGCVEAVLTRVKFW